MTRYSELHYPGDVVASIAVGRLLGAREADGELLVAEQVWLEPAVTRTRRSRLGRTFTDTVRRERTVVVVRPARPDEVSAERELVPYLLQGMSASEARWRLGDLGGAPG